MDSPANDFVDQIIQELETTGSLDDAKKIFLRAIKSFGYSGFDAFRLLNSTVEKPQNPENFVIANYDINILSDYIFGGLLQRCPAMERINRGEPPFDYAAFIRSHKGGFLVPLQRSLLTIFGVHHAWCIPLPEAGAARAVTVYMEGKDKENFDKTRHLIHILSVHAMEVFQRLAPTPNRVAQSMIEDVRPTVSTLSDRETECLCWIASGKTNQQISELLGVSINTVRFHIKNILAKLGARSRAEAVATAFADGLTFTTLNKNRD